MSADLFRLAADKLRKQTEQATPGPWKAEDDGLVWPDRMGDPVSGSSLIEDANYIEMMQPAVAVALAGLFSDLASEAEDAQTDPEADDRSPMDGLHRTARTLARAILQEVTS